MSTQAVLNGKTIAILATDGVERSELEQPRRALEQQGARTSLIAPEPGSIQAFEHHEKSVRIDVDVALEQANAGDFDALLLPGGTTNPDRLRTLPAAVALVQVFAEEGKPIAAICHGPWLLVEADLARGRTLTSWPSLKTDLRNAGAIWLDRAVVVDRGLVTSRSPDDLDAFIPKVIEVFEAGRNESHAVASQRAQGALFPSER